MSESLLKIDPQIEEQFRSSNSWRTRLSKWVTRVFRLRMYYELPYGRVSLESQLKQRTTFPTQDWEKTGVAVDEVRTVLAQVATEFNLPNDHLYPDDPLRVVFIPDYDDLPLAWLVRGLQKRLGAVYEVDELARMVSDGTLTVELFVRDVLRRRLHPVI